MLQLLWTIIVGFVAGLIATWLAPGKGPNGFFLTAALGIGGSFAATYLGRAFNLYPQGQTSGFIASIIGAVILLLVYHLLVRRK